VPLYARSTHPAQRAHLLTCSPALPLTCPRALPPAYLQEQRTACPFQQAGLKNWNDPAIWGGRLPSVSAADALPLRCRCTGSQWLVRVGVLSTVDACYFSLSLQKEF